jgi:hypothetical protein
VFVGRVAADNAVSDYNLSHHHLRFLRMCQEEEAQACYGLGKPGHFEIDLFGAESYFHENGLEVEPDSQLPAPPL